MTGGPWLFLITALKQVVDLAHVVLAVDTEDLSQTVNAADLDAICVDLEPCHVVSVLGFGCAANFDAQFREGMPA